MPNAAAAHSPRGIDHLVVGVRDLEVAARFYAGLGFTVGGQNTHPWGTINRIVQFPGCFIELISVGDAKRIPPHRPRNFSFGAFVQSALKRRQGLSMLVLESQDAKADSDAFRRDNIGDFAPFFFERSGIRPGGAKFDVAFSLAFARDAMARQCGFFTCQQHKPENFWNAAMQSHANGAAGISAAYMVAENPTDHHIFLSAWTGERSLRSNSLGIGVDLPRGRIEIVTGAAAAAIVGDKRLAHAGTPARLIGYALKVQDIEAVARLCISRKIATHTAFGRLVVPARAAMGNAILFEQI
jgi:catechol 2,3-dioxygenase-like lactoylglutathione lyase family enzyme